MLEALYPEGLKGEYQDLILKSLKGGEFLEPADWERIFKKNIGYINDHVKQQLEMVKDFEGVIAYEPEHESLLSKLFDTPKSKDELTALLYNKRLDGTHYTNGGPLDDAQIIADPNFTKI